MAKEIFRTVALDETDNWDAGFLADNHIAVAFGLYLFREDERTYCCDTSPSTWCECLQNVFIFDFEIDPEARIRLLEEHPDLGSEADPFETYRSRVIDSGLEHENLQDSDCYISFIDVKHYDPRKISGPIEFDIDEDEHGTSGNEKMNSESESYSKAAWEEAREYVSGNSVEPSILCPDVYLEYQADKRKERLAANEAPLSGREQLPLFVVAANKMKTADVLGCKGWLPKWNVEMLLHRPQEWAELDAMRGLA